MAVDLMLAGLAFLAGVLSFLSPCIIPMILVYLTTITGFSVEELVGAKHRAHLRQRVVLSTLVFVASFTLVFTLVGGAAGTLGSLLSQSFSTLTLLAGVFFLLFGTFLIAGKSLQPPAAVMKLGNRLDARLKKWGLRNTDGSLSYAGVFLVGLIQLPRS